MTASSNLTQGSNLPNVVAATVLLEFNGKRFAPSPSPRSKDKEALGDLVPKKISEDDDASNDESGDKEPKQGKGKKVKPPKKTKSSTMTKDGSVVNISSSQEQEVESDQDRVYVNLDTIKNLAFPQLFLIL
ncbi:hypothetical protein JHK87_043521 [Glycine soja]|nr:hypothetical protein JHK87_043521 [Glycine soja]